MRPERARGAPASKLCAPSETRLTPARGVAGEAAVLDRARIRLQRDLDVRRERQRGARMRRARGRSLRARTGSACRRRGRPRRCAPPGSLRAPRSSRSPQQRVDVGVLGQRLRRHGVRVEVAVRALAHAPRAGARTARAATPCGVDRSARHAPRERARPGRAAPGRDGCAGSCRRAPARRPCARRRRRGTAGRSRSRRRRAARRPMRPSQARLRRSPAQDRRRQRR